MQEKNIFMKVYVKFLSETDIYVFNPFSNEPKICDKCGSTLYIPVELSKNNNINRPIDSHHLVVPSLPTIEVNRELTPEEVKRLERFPCVTSVNSIGFSMIVADVKGEPIDHICEKDKD